MSNVTKYMKYELKKSNFKSVLNAIEELPYFNIRNLKIVDIGKEYLRIVISRLKKRGKIIALKRGVYVSTRYLNQITNRGATGLYNEFVANTIYQPSYLSCEYILEKYGIMSEAVMVITSVSTKKTNKFDNELGTFKYYSIKKELFTGFEIKQTENFSIAEASLAKALFDFLYFRKKFLNSLGEIKALRLNLENLKRKDWRELGRYIKFEDSKKMREIYNHLTRLYE